MKKFYTVSFVLEVSDDENEGFHPEGDGEHHHRTKG